MNPITLLGKPLPIFPCWPDKKPMTPHGFKDAAPDWSKFGELAGSRGRLVGVPTGEISGFDVLDIDPLGLDWAKKLPRDLTREHVTPRGGIHLLFHHNPGLRNSASKLAPGVDVRADGGYIIWWPETGLEVFNPDVIASWPPELITQLSIRNPQKNSFMATPNRKELGDFTNSGKWLNYRKCIDLLTVDEDEVDILEEIELRLTADGRLGVAIQGFYLVSKFSRESMFALQACAQTLLALSSVEVGDRNDTLNAKAFALGRIMARRWTSQRRIICALWKGAVNNGLVEEDPEAVIRTIISGLVAGYKEPYPDLE